MTPPAPPVPVLLEDNHFLAVFKPPGYVVQGAGPRDRSLREELREWIRVRDGKPGEVFLAPVHRLDKAVSGVVVLAKRSKAASRLSREIREGRFEKTYVAVVEGVPDREAATLVDALAWDDGARRMRVANPAHPDAQRAELGWTLRSVHKGLAVLEVRLVTGRKHQIRAQLAHAGHPIVGDTRYGARRRLPEGIALLSASIGFRHPVRPEEAVHIEVPVTLDPVPGWLKEAVRP